MTLKEIFEKMNCMGVRMKFRADITLCEDGRDKILSVCQVGPEDIHVDLSPLSREQRSKLEVVAKALFK